MAAGDEPAARVASRGKSPFSLEAGIEGDTRLGVHGQGPDGDVLRQEQINGILVTRLGPGIHEIDEVFTRMMAFTKMPGCAYVLCYQGRLVYAAGFGYSDLENRIAFTPYTLCEIGSVSKVVACTSMLTAVEEGRIRLDTKLVPVLEEQLAKRGYPPVPQRNPALDAITLKDAMNHSDGYFWDGASASKMGAAMGVPSNQVSEVDVCRYLLRFPPKFPAGSKSEYGSHGMQLALLDCALLYETDAEGFIKDRLVRLGIKDAYCGGSHTETDYDPNRTPSYSFDANTGSYSKIPSCHSEWRDGGSAVGTWVMSPLSLARFGDRFLDLYRDPARMERMIIDNKVAPHGGYALGWIAERLEDGSFDLYHGGMIGGWRTELKTGWYGFSHVWVFNAGPDAFNIIPEALGRPAISDDTFGKTGIPRELFPPELQNILQRLRPRLDRQRQVNLWRQAGFPD